MISSKILITGASGFIGSALIRFLKSNNIQSVVGVTRSAYHGCVSIDLMNKLILRDFLLKQKPHIIFHLAGGRHPDTTQMYIGNVVTTISLFEALSSIPSYKPKVVIVGSAAEYGPSRAVIKETVKASPVSGYGLAKLTQVNVALYYALLGQHVVIARLFNILGPGVPDSYAVGRFARDIVFLKRNVKLAHLKVDNLKGVRDFLDIRDICSALFLLSSKGKSGEIYNICSGLGMTMKNLLLKMLEITDLPKSILIENKKSDPGILYSVGSCQKLMNTTGWKPYFSTEESLRDTLNWYEKKAKR